MFCRTKMVYYALIFKQVILNFFIVDFNLKVKALQVH